MYLETLHALTEGRMHGKKVKYHVSYSL